MGAKDGNKPEIGLNMSNEPEIYFDPHDDIFAAVNALQAIDGFDVYDKRKIAMMGEIREMCLEIIYNSIQLIHSLHGKEGEANPQS